LHFTGSAPVLTGGLFFSSTTATFDHNPVIADLQLAQSSMINLNGAPSMIDGLQGDNIDSGNVINLGAGTVLTIDTNVTGTNNGGGSYHGLITGSTGSLVVIDSGSNGSLDLRGADTYGGSTTIAGGVVIASNNSALGTGPVTVTGGGLVTNTGVTLTNPLTLAGSSMSNLAGLAGFGTFSPGGTVLFQNYAGVDPGRAAIGSGGGTSLAIPVAGTLKFGAGTSISFGSNGFYLFALTDPNGAAGTGYGTVSLPGPLAITNSGSPFDIVLFSFDPATNQSGNALNFNPASSYSWTLVSAGSISGFSASDFSVIANPTNFTNSIGVEHL